jgi:hypothetical protein
MLMSRIRDSKLIIGAYALILRRRRSLRDGAKTCYTERGKFAVYFQWLAKIRRTDCGFLRAPALNDNKLS